MSTLISLPTLKNLLILSTQNFTNTLPKYAFNEKLARKLRAPIQNLQLTGLELPLTTMQILVEKIAESCQRLSIGCTFGRECENSNYLMLIQKMKVKKFYIQKSKNYYVFLKNLLFFRN